MKKGTLYIFVLLMLFFSASCATTKRTSVQDQRRGLLMLEGERVYKNKGFYKSKKSSKHRKKNIKKTQRRPRRR